MTRDLKAVSSRAMQVSGGRVLGPNGRTRERLEAQQRLTACFRKIKAGVSGWSR